MIQFVFFGEYKENFLTKKGCHESLTTSLWVGYLPFVFCYKQQQQSLDGFKGGNQQIRIL